MATQQLAKAPEPLNLKDQTHRGKHWKQFRRDWTYYEIASKIREESGAVSVAHLLNVIEREGQHMFDTFNLSEEDSADITKVLREFEGRCLPISNVIYERYVFNPGAQEVGESLDHYITDVMKQAKLCKYGNLKDELIRDRLVSGIKDDRICEKLLNKKDLTLQKAIEILQTNQATQFQVRDMATEQDMAVKVVKTSNKTVSRDGPAEGQWTRTTPSRQTKPCRYCGNIHEFKKEICPANDKECWRCGKKGHFSRVCR